MATLLWRTGFVFFIMETFAGMTANGFIVLINCTDWFRRRKLSPTDLILICLGVSRLIWQAIVMLHITMSSFFLHIYLGSYVHVILPIMWVFTNNAALWSGAWLSALYFVKIATFSHPVFLQVKLRFTGLVPWLLLGSVACSSLMIVIVLTVLKIDVSMCELYKIYTNKSCGSETEMDSSYHYLGYAVTVPHLIPFVIFLSSMTLLIISLWMHIRHLRHSGIGVRDLNTNVHLTAIKALTSFAIMFLLSFSAINLQVVLVWTRKDSFGGSLIFCTVYAMYPAVHGVILILLNPRLKQAWVGMMQRLKCLFKKTPS